MRTCVKSIQSCIIFVYRIFALANVYIKNIYFSFINFVSDNSLTYLKDEQSENKEYLYTYTIIGMVNSVATFFRAFIFAYGGIKACKKIHNSLLLSIMNVSINVYRKYLCFFFFVKYMY